MVKDRRLLQLADRIIEPGAPGSPNGKGLPIGNLTSQHFANHYLSALDHFVKEKHFLSDVHRRIHEFIKVELRLDLKREATVLAPISRGARPLKKSAWLCVCLRIPVICIGG